MSSKIFDHVIVVMFENEYCGLVLQNTVMQSIAAQGVQLTNYFGTYHPSQTNYISSIAGEQCGWSSDDTVWPLLKQKTIVDLLEAAGVSWKAYMEDYPGTPWNSQWATPAYLQAQTLPASAPPSFAPSRDGSVFDGTDYFKKHNAFSSFAANQSSQSRWQQIVDLAQFSTDLQNGNLPQYCWITPNIWNDGHYLQGTQSTPQDRTILIGQIARWLSNEFLGPLSFPGPNSRPGAGHRRLVGPASHGLESAAGQHLHGGGSQPERHRRFAAAEQSDLDRSRQRHRHGRAGRLHPADRAVAPIWRLAGGDLFAERGDDLLAADRHQSSFRLLVRLRHLDGSRLGSGRAFGAGNPGLAIAARRGGLSGRHLRLFRSARLVRAPDGNRQLRR